MEKEKSIFANSIYSVLYRTLNILLPFILSVYTAHVLLPAGIGRVAYAQNIVNYFLTAAALGIPNYGTKKIGSVQNDKRERSKVFTELFIINAASSAISFIVFMLFRSSIPALRQNYLLLVFSSMLIFNILNIEWLYAGLEEYKYIALRSIIVKTVSIIITIFFVRDTSDIYIYACILCLTSLANYVLNFIHLHKFVSFSFSEIDIARHFRYIILLFASVCATEIYTLLDSTMVGTMCSETALGYYTNAMKTARLTYTFITAACAVYLPRLSLYHQEGREEAFCALATKGMKLVLFLALPIFFGIEMLADQMIPVLYGQQFSPGIPTLRILAVLVIIFSIAYIGGHVILIAVNKEKYTMMAAFVGAISNFFLNMILIPKIGFNGAAIASVIAELLVTVVLLYNARVNITYKISRQFFLSTVTSTAIMIAVVLTIKHFTESAIISLILSVIAGGCSYFAIQYLLRNEVTINIMAEIKLRMTRR